MKVAEELGVTQDLGLRFNLVSFVPTALLALLVLMLLASGLPSREPDPAQILAAIGALSGTQIAVAVLFVLVFALILYPFQLALVRLLEGYWETTRFGAAMAAIGVELHRRELARLIEQAHEPPSISRSEDGPRTGLELHEALRRAAEQDRLRRLARRRLTTDYPSQERLLPTRLGNALRAFEDEAGQRYGLDTITMLPRLYPYLSSQVSGALDDLRDQLDIAARLCVTLLLASLISASLLFTHGWWLLLPAATTVLAWVAYRSAVQAAVAYGKQVAVAFDLHRFDMLRGLHFPLLPADREWQFNKQVSDFFLNRLSLSPDDPPDDYPDYQHPDGDDPSPQVIVVQTRSPLATLLWTAPAAAVVRISSLWRARRARAR